MKQFIQKVTSYLIIKNVSLVSLLLHLIALVLGVLYVALPFYLILWDVLGITYLLAIAFNFLLIYLNSLRINKESRLGNRIYLLGYGYLCFLAIGVLLIPLSNFLISVNYSNALLDNFITYFAVYLFSFGFLAFGVTLAFLDYRNVDNRTLWENGKGSELSLSERQLLIKKILGYTLGFFCIITLAIGVFLAYAILGAVWALGVVPQFALFVAILMMASTMLLLNLIKRPRHKRVHYTFGLIGLILSGIFLVPLLLTPYSFYDANANFSAAFGDDWNEKVDTNIASKYFMQTPFTASGYFFGIPPEECNYKADELYFDGSKSNYSQDEDIKLYYDVFWPKTDADDLPGKIDGKYSVIIKIHGGSWRYGDKGIGNMMQVNKYFAAQGYVVFDIQYGMKEMPKQEGDILQMITPENVLGDFDINDMVRHIGNFTKHLVSVEDDYDLNLDSVFVSGGSAGGHLTCTTALGIASGDYEDVFGSNVTIKGIIPFYPANGYSGLDGEDEFKFPEKYLVDENSPPMLIFQGTHDLPCAAVSRRIKENYDDADNKKCCILYSYLGGHVSDLYFSGYYNTVFMYYMERFLYLSVNGEIE